MLSESVWLGRPVVRLDQRCLEFVWCTDDKGSPQSAREGVYLDRMPGGVAQSSSQGKAGISVQAEKS